MSLPALLAVASTTFAPIHLEVHAATITGTISPYVYGMNQPDWGGRTKSLTLWRWGGNRTTAYNWENNASNAGTDWYNQNDDYLGGGETPGKAVSQWMTKAANLGAASLVTIPIVGHVAADKNGGGDVNQTQDYLNVRFHDAPAKKPTALKFIPDKNDGVVYMDEFANFLARKNFTKGNPLFFELDNEPDLWPFTHPRIHPDHATYAGFLDQSEEYASAIKNVAPNSLIFGPVSYGWHGYRTLQDSPDANGRFFLDFYLSEMKSRSQAQGRRLLDVLDLHWYPEAQGAGMRITTDAANQDLYDARMQAPRSLWDSTYTETSWISQWETSGPIDLLHLMQNKISANYPGTKLGFTEWNYGGGNHISGGIAVADVLGIYGKYGVFAATYWNLYGDESFAYGGFDAFQNFDGAGGKFGDKELETVNPAAEKVSIYASKATGVNKTLVLVVINKATTAQNVTVEVTGGLPASATAFRMRGNNSRMVGAVAPTITNHNLQATLPAMSVTTYRVQLG